MGIRRDIDRSRLSEEQRLWLEVWEVQDASNPAGVAGGMQRAIGAMYRMGLDTPTASVHPVTRLWLLKLMSLCSVYGHNLCSVEDQCYRGVSRQLEDWGMLDGCGPSTTQYGVQAPAPE